MCALLARDEHNKPYVVIKSGGCRCTSERASVDSIRATRGAVSVASVRDILQRWSTAGRKEVDRAGTT